MFTIILKFNLSTVIFKNFVTVNYITGKLRIIENTGEKNCSGCFYFEGKMRKSKLSLEKKNSMALLS